MVMIAVNEDAVNHQVVFDTPRPRRDLPVVRDRKTVSRYLPSIESTGSSKIA
jgi:hypothetical protein